jgi:hypothetical protein
MKQVINKNFDGYVPSNNVNPKKIYISQKEGEKWIHKLHLQYLPYNSDRLYFWDVLSDTDTWTSPYNDTNIIFKSIQEAIDDRINNESLVYELNSLEELGEYLIKLRKEK